MRGVGQQQDQPAAGAQDTNHLVQRVAVIHPMLQLRIGEDAIELAVGEGQGAGVHVALLRIHPAGARARHRDVGQIGGDHGRAAALQHGRQPAGTTVHLQHALPRAHVPGEERQAVVIYLIVWLGLPVGVVVSDKVQANLICACDIAS